MKNLFLGVAAIALIASPALADVKAGVDAWNRGDYKGAVDQWRPQAVAGDPDAQFNMAQAYKLGRGVPVDLTMAEEWYRKAAIQGHPQAQINYGLALFQNGKREAAAPWLEKSAMRGDARAQFVYGTMLFNGDAGMKRDFVRAYAMMQRASDQGLPQASQALAQMDGYVGLADRQAGITLAHQYEAQAAQQTYSPEISGGSGNGMQGVDLPPSNVGGQEPGITPPPVTRPKPPRPTPPVDTATRPPVERPTPVAASGAWKLQLGAFGEPGNAKKLWSQVGGRFAGHSVSYPISGRLTRVLVGPFASQSEAKAACKGLSPCVPVTN